MAVEYTIVILKYYWRNFRDPTKKHAVVELQVVNKAHVCPTVTD